MRVVFASDHAGFELKNILLEYVKNELGHEVEDCGAYELNPEDDYPEFIGKAAEIVSKDQSVRAIILGGSGQGEAMYSNRFKGVRAAVFYGGNNEIVKLSRQHNDANILSLGARFVTEEEAKASVKLWLEEDLLKDEKYSRRIHMID